MLTIRFAALDDVPLLEDMICEFAKLRPVAAIQPREERWDNSASFIGSSCSCF
jgi:hypothetical protein